MSNPAHENEGAIHELPLLLKLKRHFLVLFLVLAVLPAPAGHASVSQGEVCNKFVLKNGAVVLHEYVPDSPLVTIEIRVSSGLSNEGKYAGSGISHFLEHLLFKGANTKTSSEIRREIKRMGGIVNGATGLDSAEYYIIVPVENFNRAVSLLADMVMSPVFTDKEFETERDVILKEIRLHNDDPLSKRMQALFSLAYDKHVYKYPVIGTEDAFLALTRDDVLKYHNLRYTPEKMVVGIAGGLPREAAFRAVFSALNRYKRGKAEEAAILDEPVAISEKIKKIPADVTMGYLAMGFHTVSLYSDDLYAGDALSILLGGGNDSRLYRKLVKEKQLLYTLSCENYTPKYPGLFIVTGVGAPKKMDEARAEILACISELAAGDVSDEELERAKKNVISDYLHSHEMNSSLASSMTTSQLLTGDPYFYDKYVERMQHVTKEDVKRVLVKYLVQNNLSTVELVPEELGVGSGELGVRSQELGVLPTSYSKLQANDSERTAVRPTIPGSRVPFEPRATNDERRATVLALDNGLKIVAEKRPRLPLVSITFAANGGLRAETKEKSGISNLTAATLLKGTKTRSEEKIVPEIEKNGGSIDTFSGFNSIGLTVDLLSEDLASGMDIFEDVLKNAVFPEEEVLKEKKKIIAGINEEDHDIFANGLIHLRRLLFKSHPYARRVAGEAETVEFIAQSDLTDFYKARFKPDGAVMTIVGDFDDDALKNIAERFQNWEGRALPLAGEGVPPITAPEEEHISMRKEEAMVLLGYPGVDVKDERKYALETICALLSGSDGLLFDALREKEGLVYSSGAVLVPEVDSGFFAVYALTSDENIDKARSIIPAMIDKIKRGEISDDDLESSKNRLISQHALNLETNSAISVTMSLDELYGLGAENSRSYSQKIRAVTRESITRAAREIFNDKKTATVIVHSLRHT